MEGIKNRYTALQIVGSPTSQFFFDLSILYAKDVVAPQEFKLLFAVIYPDGNWSISPSIDEKSEKIGLSEFISKLSDVDVVVPHLFCDKGLTTIRILFEDTLGIPLVGSSGYTLKIAQDKQMTKRIGQEENVGLPKSFVVRSVEEAIVKVDMMNFPVIVKPNTSDNSEGLTLVRESRDLEKAIYEALQFCTKIIVEEFIDGREIRAAILEIDNEFELLPAIEYHVNHSNPIRKKSDKLLFDVEGKLVAQSDKIEIPATCPAILNTTLETQLKKTMITMHRAMGCRDFSMYDFRICKDTEQSFLLEAGLFWSFSETSMISKMIKTTTFDLNSITSKIWQQALKRKS
ncbi:ATP-grasp domain-containing protein [Aquimarina sp. U1-2]|uniref:D-alanine--D-alanine ligase family protein n=1 Tax=Aquimarina sp. U1-2 TaxID=2823141 RepID=UPI001AEC826F|nr:ATP-grasp domain-containing protein [Aquimarina sp. U1-2]